MRAHPSRAEREPRSRRQPTEGGPRATGEARLRESPRRPMMLDQHPVRPPRRAGTLGVDDDGRGLVRDLPAGVAESPTQVGVLHIHEVAFVPTADLVERRSPQPDRGTRHPVDETGDSRVGVELSISDRERIPRPPKAEAVRDRPRPGSTETFGPSDSRNRRGCAAAARMQPAEAHRGGGRRAARPRPPRARCRD